MTTTTEIVMGDAQTQAHPSHLPPLAMDIDRLTFPTDFKIPEGVVIIPFKDFKERGIRIEPGPEGEEVDAIGIPTIPMRHHDADRCKTNTRRKQKKEEASKKKALNNSSPWWERWEEDEESRIAKPTNATDSKVQKFLSAASDFKNGRTWPTGVNQQVDPNYIWTRLEMFLGITGTKVGKSAKKKSKAFRDPDPEPNSDESDGEGVESGEEFVTGKDKKTLAFIRDPETATKIFLSSFARSKGIIWSEINLKQLPLLMKFFLEFLVRSRVFKDSETGFRLAVQVCHQALQELPLGYQLSADLCPEPFGQACRLVFGQKAEGFKIFKWDDEPDVDPSDPAVLEEPEQDGPEIELLSSESAANQVTSSDWGSAEATSGSWGGSWGTENAWAPAPAPAINDPEAVQWGASEDDVKAKEEEDQVVQQWLKEENVKPTVELPSSLASTHTTGIVERSLRKITNLVPIPANLPPAPATAKDAPPDPADIEALLERSFPKVVLSPWLNWDGGEMPIYSDPTILETSQGPAVEAPYTARPAGEEPPKLAPGEAKKHDPGNDEITILVEPGIFDKLQNAKGMSIAGTWVQIVRQPKVEADEAGPAKKKKKSKKKANLWYIDDLAGVFPSFWSI